MGKEAQPRFPYPSPTPEESSVIVPTLIFLSKRPLRVTAQLLVSYGYNIFRFKFKIPSFFQCAFFDEAISFTYGIKSIFVKLTADFGFALDTY